MSEILSRKGKENNFVGLELLISCLLHNLKKYLLHNLFIWRKIIITKICLIVLNSFFQGSKFK